MCARNLEWGCGRGHKAGRGEEPRFETEQIPSGLGVGRIFWVGGTGFRGHGGHQAEGLVLQVRERQTGFGEGQHLDFCSG